MGTLGAVASFAGPIVEVGKCIAVPIHRQFTYLCCFNDNVQLLKDEAQKLRDAQVGLQWKVDAAKRNTHKVFPQVKTWLENATSKLEVVNGIVKDIPSVQKRYLNPVKHYSVSRRAKKTADSLREFNSSCPSEEISQDASPASMGSIRYGQKLAFESRKKVEEEIMEALRSRNVSVIGICGMGGVGKTTMAERIIQRVCDEKLFVDVVLIQIGPQTDEYKIQGEIAEYLGLKLRDNETIPARARRLRMRLSDSNKGYLIVLDNIWQRLELHALGIPCESSEVVKSKVLLTSRNRDVLNKMDAQSFEVKVLDEKEAWFLFKEKIGDRVEKPDLDRVAKEVVKQCRCLPIALVTVGLALKYTTSLVLWEDALDQLILGLPLLQKDVYMSIKLSYDTLETQDDKCLFLLCSMFKNDSNVDLEVLTWYGMGLQMFQGTSMSLSRARKRTMAMVDVLKSRFLLLDGVKEGDVKMHDVVRNTARYIASDKGFTINLGKMPIHWPKSRTHSEDQTWISLILASDRMDSLGQIPLSLRYPDLRLLLLQKEQDFLFTKPLDIPNNFFHGMEEITILSLEDMWIKSLPLRRMEKTGILLENIQTLRFSNCKISESIAVVGELSTLEILSFHSCEEIKALPTEFEKLNHLKVLEIIKCASLETIPAGMISKLVCMEELKIRESFDGWEGKRNGNSTNAALVELESLTNLTCLEIEINYYHLVSEEIFLPPKIVKYSILISAWSLVQQFSKSLSMEILEEVNIANWIRKLLSSCENLEVSGGDGSNNIKSLKCGAGYTEKKLLNLTGGFTDSDVSSPTSESLDPKSHLARSIEIFEDPYPREEVDHISFLNLTFIEIHHCENLHYLFPSSLARNLLQLKTLAITNCESMEAVFICDENKQQSVMPKEDAAGKSGDHELLVHFDFPELQVIRLLELPRLTSLCNGVHSIGIPNIIEINICKTPKLRSLIQNLESEASSLHELFNHKVKTVDVLRKLNLLDLDASISTCIWSDQLFSNVIIFHNLVELRVYSLNGIKKLMAPSIALHMVSLKRLEVGECTELLYTISNDGFGDDDDDVEDEPQILMGVTLFPHLENLILVDNPKLRFLCEWKHVHVKFSSLETIMINTCPQLKALAQTQKTCFAPNLWKIYLNGEILDKTRGPQIGVIFEEVQQHTLHCSTRKM